MACIWDIWFILDITISKIKKKLFGDQYFNVTSKYTNGTIYPIFLCDWRHKSCLIGKCMQALQRARPGNASMYLQDYTYKYVYKIKLCMLSIMIVRLMIINNLYITFITIPHVRLQQQYWIIYNQNDMVHTIIDSAFLWAPAVSRSELLIPSYRELLLV